MQSTTSMTGCLGLLAIVLFWASCERTTPNQQAGSVTPTPAQPPVEKQSPAVSEAKLTDPNIITWHHPRSNERQADRQQMVQVLKKQYGMTDLRVLQAMGNVPRHWFVPSGRQSSAYYDSPLPIGHGQTISQPFIVAYMTHLLDLTPDKKVLEIGTGSGYQAAVLSELTSQVFTIEIVEPLGRRAKAEFDKRGYKTIRTLIGDGYKGWPEHAPFDAVIVTCAPDHIPQPLIDQLKPGGCIVVPVGGSWLGQDLVKVTKNPDGTLEKKSMLPVRFVPLVRDRED